MKQKEASEVTGVKAERDPHCPTGQDIAGNCDPFSRASDPIGKVGSTASFDLDKMLDRAEDFLGKTDKVGVDRSLSLEQTARKPFLEEEASDLKDDKEFAGFNIEFLKVSKSTLKQIDVEIDVDDNMK